MNRILFISIAVLLTLSSTKVNAQTDWELPDSQKPAVATATSKKAKEDKTDVDRMYLAGAIPEKDGRVVFTFSNSVPSMSAEALYEKAYRWLEEMVKEENQLDSRIALVNKAEHKIIAKFSEWLVFSRSLLAVDRTRFTYVLTIECKDGLVEMEMSRIFYHYDEDRPSRLDVSAEQWVTDAVAISKDGQKFVRGRKKFRKQTVIRANEINNSLKLYLMK